MWSGQSGRQKESGDVKSKDTTLHRESQRKTIVLPNQMRDEENRALGVGYMSEEDQLYVLASVNFSKRRKKMRLGNDLCKDVQRPGTPNPLSRRVIKPSSWTLRLHWPGDTSEAERCHPGKEGLPVLHQLTGQASPG